MSYEPIENYGAIGDMKTVALVGLTGSIDFFCFPDFDSPSAFASLLDDEKGGYFKIAPASPHIRRSQLYVPDTNVLLTRFMSSDSILEITDFMPIGDGRSASKIVRVVRAIRGCISVSMTCAPAFGYNQDSCQVALERQGRRVVFTGTERQRLELEATAEMNLDDGRATAQFSVEPGKTAYFVLTCNGDAGHEPSQGDIQELEKQTIAFWRKWVSKITYRGRWQEAVNRSALVLKLLTSAEYGSIIAAPTFSLPEAIGGRRNWDYRYCWIRDSAFTVYAFMRLGLKHEAIAFARWVEALYRKAREGSGALQLMYRIDGSTEVSESELPHFEGYNCSGPVRIGNAAYEQFQLDIYGELLDAIALTNTHVTKISHDAWRDVVATAGYVCSNWRRPDSGIWEFRGEQREFLHSRLMCWVALDRALRLSREESLPADVDLWKKARSDIYDDIFANFWNDELKSFVQHKHATTVDASVLLMPLVDFIGPHDPRWLSTLAMVEKTLVNGTLVHRYQVDKIDLRPVDSSHEGSFNACSFWYVACLARGSRQEEAWLLFAKMLGYGNHLGLFSEETGIDGHHLGNFPQALSHLALINAVFALEESVETERAPNK